jgi:hypothetical protein
VDAVDAESYLNTLSVVFAAGSLVAILFFFRRATGVSLALLGWWICFLAAFLITAPDTISGREDVAAWASETAWIAFVGLAVGGCIGTTIDRPRASARFLAGSAIIAAPIGVVLIWAFWRLSEVSCRGPLSAEHRKEGYELDTTFCAGNAVLGRWIIVYVASIVALFLLSAGRARFQHHGAAR